MTLLRCLALCLLAFATPAHADLSEPIKALPESLIKDILERNFQSFVTKLRTSSDPNEQSASVFGGATPLMVAITTAELDDDDRFFEALVRYKPDFGRTDNLGRSALYVATSVGYARGILVALNDPVGRQTANIPDGRMNVTPLFLAVARGHEDIANMLIPYTTNLSQKDYSGETVIDFCRTKMVDFSPCKNILAR
jgi:ankyrin repeat protein